MSKPIWCLFSVANEHDQPNNNLERFWHEKPSIEKLAAVLGYPMNTAKDEDIVKVVLVWQGTPQRLKFDADYRLEQLEEGVAP